MKRYESIYVVLIGFALIFNVFLLLKNKQLKDHIQSLYLQIIYIENQINIKNNEIIEKTLENRIFTDSRIKISENGFTFIFLVPEKNCKILENEISNFNRIYEVSGLNFAAYVLAEKKSLIFLERFEARFSYEVIEPSISIGENTYIFENPLSLLVDSEGFIHKAIVSDGRNSEKMDQFYQEINSFIEK